MINKVEIKNFYSYEDAMIEFDPNMNAIVGDPRAGKTTVRRAIEWVRYNRPQGKGIISYWNRDKKGDIANETSVIVTLNNNEVQRLRDKSTNGYVTNGESYDAVRASVPEEVERIFNFDEVNLQKQFDLHFLLSESPGEVARFFNQAVKLDKIDSILGKTERKRRDTEKEIKDLDKDIIEYLEKLESYAWIDTVEPLLNKLEEKEKEINGGVTKMHELKKYVEVYKELTNKRDSYPSNSEEVFILIEDALENSRRLKEQGAEIKELNIIIDRVQQFNSEIDTFSKFSNVAYQNILTASKLEVDIQEKQKRYKTIDNFLRLSKNSQNEIDLLVADIKKYASMLPDVCPTCGNILDECKTTHKEQSI